jgi:hypothetical protein
MTEIYKRACQPCRRLNNGCIHVYILNGMFKSLTSSSDLQTRAEEVAEMFDLVQNCDFLVSHPSFFRVFEAKCFELDDQLVKMNLPSSALLANKIRQKKRARMVESVCGPKVTRSGKTY